MLCRGNWLGALSRSHRSSYLWREGKGKDTEEMGSYGQGHHFFILELSLEWGRGKKKKSQPLPMIKLGPASVLSHFLVENKLVGFWSGKMRRAMAGHLLLPSLSSQGTSCSQVPSLNNRLLTCAWPGLCTQQTHSLQGPGPLQSSKAPSDEEWPATEQDRAQFEEDRVRT